MKIKDLSVDLKGGSAKPGFESAGEILFNHQPEKVDVLAQAEAILFQTHHAVESKIIRPTWSVVLPVVEHNVVALPALKPAVKSETAQAIRPKTVFLESTRPAEQRQVEETVEEKVLVKKEQKDETKPKNERDTSFSKIKLVKAEEIAQERKHKIIEATRRLIGSITGVRFKHFLSLEFWKLKSPIVGKRKDYTLDLTVAEIESDYRVYETPEQAAEAFVGAVERNVPVKRGEEGRTVTLEEVRKVTHGVKEEPRTPAEMVIKRVVRKTVATQSSAPKVQEDRTEVEGSLKDLHLEEVLAPKAA